MKSKTTSRAWRLLMLAILAAASVLAMAQAQSPSTQPATQPERAPGAAPAPGPAALGGLFRAGSQVAVIRIEGMIYDFVLDSLKRRVQRARDAGASVIVIELDTPGGVVTSALKISKYLKSLELPTVAWINNEAYSAGIMIASACDAIVMAPSSATGDCAPIVPGQSLEPTERAKALSPILAEFRDSAQANGYDYVLFHAMCVLGVEVYEVQHRQTGQTRLVNEVDYRVMVKNESLSMAKQGGPLGFLNSGGKEMDPGAPGLDVATPADRGQWELIGQVHSGSTLLTVNQNEAVKIGLAADGNVRNLGDIKTVTGATRVDRVSQTWSEDLAHWLTSPPVRAILVIALLLGAYTEFQAPGFGLPGVVALLAFIVLIGAPFLIGLAEVWHILLILLGVVLLVAELFFAGFGVLGIAGITLFFMGLILAIVPTGDGPMPLPDAAAIRRLEQSALWMLLALIGSTIGAYYLTRNLYRLPGLSRLILANDLAASTAAGADQPLPVSGDEAIAHGNITVGTVGLTRMPLRPTGRAEFDGQVADVVTRGEWIDRSRRVRVTEVSGNHIVVESDDA